MQKNFFTKESESTKTTREQQIIYLKEHKQEMTDYIKSQNSKVTSVEWDWDSVKVVAVQPDAGGIHVGEKHYELRIEGKFNSIENSSFISIAQLEDENSYPKIKAFYLSQPLRVGGRLYE